MSDAIDDLEAEGRMTSRAHLALAQVQPDNEWLRYYDPQTTDVEVAPLVERLWGETWKYGTQSHDLHHLMGKYRDRLLQERGTTQALEEILVKTKRQ